MKISMSEFKAKCTQVVREVSTAPDIVEITKHGKVVAVVTAPRSETKHEPRFYWGSLRGTVLYLDPSFDEPMGDSEWEASR